MDNRPIGVFDSGVGGLSAVKELHRLLPNENLIYFGDTARLPYGTRSHETLVQYIAQDIAFLRRHDCKLVLAACGTVSSNMTPALEASATVPFYGVVSPAVDAAAAATKNGKIGVIATSASIRTGAYRRALTSLHPEMTLLEKACPLFVPLVENGLIEDDNEITEKVAQMYLAPLYEAGIDTLILGCTHFPLIAGILDKVLHHKVALIDSGYCLARQALTHLTRTDGFGGQGQTTYYVTDSPESFSEVASLFLGESISGTVERVGLDSLSCQTQPESKTRTSN